MTHSSKVVKPPTNEEFIAFLFRDLPQHASPLGASFPYHPKDDEGEAKWKWKAIPITLDTTLHQPSSWPAFNDPFSPKQSNYVSISSFYQIEGKWRRRVEQWAAMHALMIDDVGQKVDPKMLTLAPTIAIETSPSNLQCWYALTKPITDQQQATTLVASTTRKFNHDARDITRVGRLPVGSNTKYDPPYQQRTLAAPGYSYTLEQLIEGLGLEPYLVAPSLPQAVQTQTQTQTNAYAEWLRENDYVISQSGAWLNLHCPFGNHDDDGRAGYKLPDQQNPNGHFHCPHGKCKPYGTHHLIALIHEIVIGRRQ